MNYRTLDMHELQEELDSIREQFPDVGEWDLQRAQAIRDLFNTVEGYAGTDPTDVVLIDESDFEEYAQDWAEQTGAMRYYAEWPYSCIDWSQAADELRHDYTGVEFEGTTYYFS